MIDTIKMVTMIPLKLFNIIQDNSIIKTSLDNSTGKIYYKIINGSIEGSYNSSLSIRTRRRKKV